VKTIVVLFATVFNIIQAFSQSGLEDVAVKSTSAFNRVPDSFEKIIFPTINSDSSRPYALVAGGSKGIGYAIAEALAKRKYNLILIARHYDSLLGAKNKLESLYQIHVELLVNDLSREESADEIAQWCINRNIALKILCNVAGSGGAKDYLSLPLDTLRYMVRLNVESCMALSLRLLPLLE